MSPTAGVFYTGRNHNQNSTFLSGEYRNESCSFLSSFFLATSTLHTFFSPRENPGKSHSSCQRSDQFCFYESCCGNEFVIYREDFKKLTKTPVLDISSEFLSFNLTLPAASSTRYIPPSLRGSSLQPPRVHHHGARRHRTPLWSPLQVPARYRCE